MQEEPILQTLTGIQNTNNLKTSIIQSLLSFFSLVCLLRKHPGIRDFSNVEFPNFENLHKEALHNSAFSSHQAMIKRLPDKHLKLGLFSGAEEQLKVGVNNYTQCALCPCLAFGLLKVSSLEFQPRT